MNTQTLPPSRFYHFIDSHQGVAIYFLEGQKIISELVTRNEISNEVFQINRHALLSLLPLNAFLKPQESMGIFVDSEVPYFRFKLEMNETGTFRNMLLHDKQLSEQQQWNGKIRLVKMMPGSKTPYQSVIEMDDMAPTNLLNVILEQSYQSKCHLIISSDSDQAVLLHLLPQKNYDKQGFAEAITLEELLKKRAKELKTIMQKALVDEYAIIKAFEGLELTYLSSKEILFHCPCSKEQMLFNLKKIGQVELNQIMQEDGQIEIICDYCNSQYIFTEDDLALKTFS